MIDFRLKWYLQFYMLVFCMIPDDVFRAQEKYVDICYC